MEDFVISTGKYAAAIMSVIGLFTLIAWKPYTKHREKVRMREEAERQAQAEFQSRVLTGLEELRAGVASVSEDVGDLQCDRLTAAHDHFMELGYCPDSTKQALCEMYRSYSGKGRNHLAAHYEENILNLPNERKAG